jgi:hypothetical protein
MSSQTTGGFQPAVFSVSVATATSYAGTVAIVFGGNGYVQGDVVVIPGTFFKSSRYTGTSPANDLTVTLTTVANGVITEITSAGTSPTTSSGNVTGTFDLEFLNGRNKPTLLRDSSDYTRQLKERLVYNEFQNQVNNAKQDRRGGISSAGPGSAGTLDLQQSNQFRMSYLFGKRNCGNCAGGWFNTNGVRNFNSSGVQSGT